MSKSKKVVKFSWEVVLREKIVQEMKIFITGKGESTIEASAQWPNYQIPRFTDAVYQVKVDNNCAVVTGAGWDVTPRDSIIVILSVAQAPLIGVLPDRVPRQKVAGGDRGGNLERISL